MEKVIQIVNSFKSLEETEAIVLSGSRRGLFFDENSDYDIYIYSEKTPSIEFRNVLAEKFALKAEVGNDFFEQGDEWILPDNSNVDIMYRDFSSIKEHIKNVWHKHNASVGFSTAIIHNIKTSKILYDKNKAFAKIQNDLNSPYPQQLKENIIKKNYPLLRSKMSASFYEQLEKAIERNDLISQNHRVTALLNSYFDIIFALNEKTHPGEKRLINWAIKTCKILPNNFQQNLEAIIRNIGQKEILSIINNMLDELDKILKN